MLSQSEREQSHRRDGGARWNDNMGDIISNICLQVSKIFYKILFFVQRAGYACSVKPVYVNGTSSTWMFNLSKHLSRWRHNVRLALWYRKSSGPITENVYLVTTVKPVCWYVIVLILYRHVSSGWFNLELWQGLLAVSLHVDPLLHMLIKGM